VLARVWPVVATWEQTTQWKPRDPRARAVRSGSRYGAERALQQRERLRQLPGAGEPECFGHAGDAVVVHERPFGV
jgi:hypothetical protein